MREILITLFFLVSIQSFAGPTPKSKIERYILPLEEVLDTNICLSNIVQLNGVEPLATCNQPILGDGVIKPVAIIPFGLHDEFKVEWNNGVDCIGGIRADANLRNQLQIYASLAPWRDDYTKDLFEKCFTFVIKKLADKNRVVHFDVIKN